jgi:dienelactone hydrolase
LSADDERRRLLALLGDLPARDRVPEGRRLDAATRGGAAVERWSLDLNGRERVPALVVSPPAPRAVVLYCHAHGNRFDIGKDELIAGRPAFASPPYADALAAMGVAALAIDHWGFGERAATSERLLGKRFLWDGSTLWGMRVADTLAAFDWLAREPRYAALPVITLGMSMGSTMAWWSAALEPRIAACVDLCCLAEFDALSATGADDLHGEYFFVPGLRKHFTAAAINALIAPRPHLSCAGADDPLTPRSGVSAIDRAMRAAYAEAGAPEAWQQRVLPGGHAESPAMRAAVLAFIASLLPPPL